MGRVFGRRRERRGSGDKWKREYGRKARAGRDGRQIDAPGVERQWPPVDGRDGGGGGDGVGELDADESGVWDGEV